MTCQDAIQGANVSTIVICKRGNEQESNKPNDTKKPDRDSKREQQNNLKYNGGGDLVTMVENATGCQSVPDIQEALIDSGYDVNLAIASVMQLMEVLSTKSPENESEEGKNPDLPPSGDDNQLDVNKKKGNVKHPGNRLTGRQKKELKHQRKRERMAAARKEQLELSQEQKLLPTSKKENDIGHSLATQIEAVVI